LAKKDLPQKVFDELTYELGKAMLSNNHAANNDDEVLPKPKKTLDELHRDIIIKSSETANSISESIIKNEKSKNFWRVFFIIFFSVLLIFTLVVIFTLIYLDANGIIIISDAVIISLLTYVIANIFSILYFMVKYVNNSEYLKLFKNVTQKMLEYIIQHKYITTNHKPNLEKTEAEE
jgi:hypothetical protein